MSDLTHFNESGEAHMVDVGGKDATHRVAVAEGLIRMLPETMALIRRGGHKKGDVLAIARVAGIMAAKRTSDLVPLCHPLALTKVAIEPRPGRRTRLCIAVRWCRPEGRQAWRWRPCAQCR